VTSYILEQRVSFVLDHRKATTCTYVPTYIAYGHNSGYHGAHFSSLDHTERILSAIVGVPVSFLSSSSTFFFSTNWR
jgi:hypothetical protein